MGEHLADTLLAAASFLRYLERYEVSNAIVLFSRVVRAVGVETLDDLEEWVTSEEQARDVRESLPSGGQT